MIRKTLLSALLFLTLFCSIPLLAATPLETLNYKVIYRWGLVNKQAGRASFKLYDHGHGQYQAIMCARTEPWADHFFRSEERRVGKECRIGCRYRGSPDH